MSGTIGAIEAISMQKKEFQGKYSQEFLANFDHAPVVRGDGDLEKMKKVRDSLNLFAESIHLQVRFDNSFPLGFLVGGGCTPLSLRVAEKGFEFLSSPRGPEEMKSFVETFRKEANRNKRFKREIRGEQIACNTMVVAENVDPLTIEKDKVAAIAGLKKLYVESESMKLVVQSGISQEEIYEEISKLGAGVYLMRQNLPSQNHKLEEQGHTATLIVFDEKIRVLFDPNFGLFKVDLGSDLFFQMLNSTFTHFGVCSLGLYKLSKEKTDPVVKNALPQIFRQCRETCITRVSINALKPNGFFATPPSAKGLVILLPGSGSRVESPGYSCLNEQRCRETCITRVSINALKLNGFLATPPSVKGVVVLLPGSGSRVESSPGYFTMGSCLNEQHFATLAVDLVLESEKKQEFQKDGVPRLVNEPAYMKELIQRVHSTVVYASNAFPNLPIAILGASTGAALALHEASNNDTIRAVVSRGGRPDIVSKEILRKVTQPLLLLAGTEDPEVRKASHEAFSSMNEGDVQMIEIKGANHGFTGKGHLQEAMKQASIFFIEKMQK
ncbi:MAG: putative phosphoribosyl transferase [Chlamydiae bacterium]|nr:putative phosphoribosyl transferase [Chlamydiota bacterium]